MTVNVGDAFDLLTLTRASGGMRTNRNALLEWMGNNVPRMDYDPLTLAPRGLLLEGGRTNVLTRSQEFDNAAWGKTNATATANAAVAPDGTTTADLITEDASSAGHAVSQAAVSFTTGVSYTLSVFAKVATGTRNIRLGFPSLYVPSTSRSAVFNLVSGTVAQADAGVTATIRALRNGWFRVALTVTAAGTGLESIFINLYDGTSPTYTGDGASGLYIWGAQLEAGAFPSSYIPTTTAAASRAADVCSIPVTDFPFNPAEGTLFAEASIDRQSSASIEIANLFDGTNNNRIRLGISPSNLSNTLIVAGGVIQFNHSGASSASGAIRRIATSFKSNDAASAVNGSLIGTSTVVLMPAGVTTLRVASDLYGHVRKLIYFPRRLSNAELQALTA